MLDTLRTVPFIIRDMENLEEFVNVFEGHDEKTRSVGPGRLPRLQLSIRHATEEEKEELFEPQLLRYFTWPEVDLSRMFLEHVHFVQIAPGRRVAFFSGNYPYRVGAHPVQGFFYMQKPGRRLGDRSCMLGTLLFWTWLESLPHDRVWPCLNVPLPT